jgi:hypothetical protein
MRAFAFTLTALLAVSAWAADVSIAVPSAKPGPPAVAGVAVDNGGHDAEVELYVETVTGATGGFAWYTGAEAWVGNDFSLATLTNYLKIVKARFYQWPYWPNSTYEGYRAGVYSFAGGVPGSLLWGPTYMAHTGAQWNEWPDINYVLPSHTEEFMMAGEQFYDYPNCDNWCVATGAGSGHGHSWYYYRGWGKIPAASGGDDLMLRVTVSDEIPAVTPASLGRVKALYR